ncbi:helix-turn-helix domain-containing protein [Epilithonimonas sp.]|uniref:helix-turn-helix domain-containing protein n=1 Tax=Epilithonimonas sp. TaxID=2894511 RepID=UPI0028B2562C|nr:helix-turn-helix domain-containing protein [Epilithonimonas sp.]
MEAIKNNGFENPVKNVTNTIRRLVFGTSLKNQTQQPEQPQLQKELLTREETATFFDVDLSTLHNWKKKGILLPVGIGGRVYYRMSDIEKALTPLN